MTGAEIMAVVGFFTMLFGTLFGAWKYIEGKIAAARTETNIAVAAAGAKAELAITQLHEHRLHAAQTFATKQGMQEQTAQMLRAIEGVASRIDGLTERLDNIIMQRPSGRRAS